jgi:hypothetical protein
MSKDARIVNIGWGLITIWLGASIILSTLSGVDFLVMFSIGTGVTMLILSYITYKYTQNFPLLSSLTGILILIFGLYLLVGRPEILLGLLLIILGIFILVYETILKT